MIAGFINGSPGQPDSLTRAKARNNGRPQQLPGLLGRVLFKRVKKSDGRRSRLRFAPPQGEALHFSHALSRAMTQQRFRQNDIHVKRLRFQHVPRRARKTRCGVFDPMRRDASGGSNALPASRSSMLAGASDQSNLLSV
jgi:hypothetical protein